MRDAPAAEASVLVLAQDGALPAWAAALPSRDGRGALAPDLDDATLTRELDGTPAVLIDAEVGAPLSVARRVHRIAPGVQIVVVAAEAALQDLRRAMMFAPGIGEVWLHAPDEVSPALVERACSVGESRLRHSARGSTLARQVATLAPSTERRIVLADRYLATLLELLPDPVLALDDDDSVLFANPAAAALLRVRSSAAVTGAELRSRLAPADAAAFEDLLERGRHGAARATLGLRAGHEGGGSFDAAIAPVGGERPVRALLLHDITEQVEIRQRLEEQAVELETQATELEMQGQELQERNEELAAAIRHRSRFYASMSHELRTPINAILGYNDLMLSGVFGEMPEAQQSALERAHVAANHLLELVNDVLDLSKIEAGKLTIAPEPVNVGELLAELRTTLEPLAEANGVAVDFDADHSCTDPFVTDPRRLRQILTNLLSNAIRYGDGKPIAVRCSIANGTLTASVQDNGPGIPPDQLDRIFDEFVQVGDRDQGGTGLGLPIGRALAHALGGTLTARSKLGEGSTFTLRIPELHAET